MTAVNFKDDFEKSSVYPSEATYKGRKIFIADKFIVGNQERLRISIEHTDSKYIQGFSIGVYGYLKLGKKKTNKRKYADVLFWVCCISL